MRSRLSVLAERLGLEGIGIVLFLTVVLAVALILFWVRTTGMASSLALGPLGMREVIEEFPYQWLIVGLLAFGAIAGLLRASIITGRPASGVFVVTVVFSAIGLGVVIAYSGATERLLRTADTDQPGRPLQAIYELTEHHGRTGLVGNVVETHPTGFIVQVHHETVFVTVTSTTRGSTTSTVVPGDRILVVSPSAHGQTIEAMGIRRLPPLLIPHFNWTSQRLPTPVSS